MKALMAGFNGLMTWLRRIFMIRFTMDVFARFGKLFVAAVYFEEYVERHGVLQACGILVQPRSLLGVC